MEATQRGARRTSARFREKIGPARENSHVTRFLARRIRGRGRVPACHLLVSASAPPRRRMSSSPPASSIRSPPVLLLPSSSPAHPRLTSPTPLLIVLCSSTGSYSSLTRGLEAARLQRRTPPRQPPQASKVSSLPSLFISLPPPAASLPCSEIFCSSPMLHSPLHLQPPLFLSLQPDCLRMEPCCDFSFLSNSLVN